jgi:hypothetical protein
MSKKFHGFKSRQTGELIPAVIFEFHNWQNLYMTKQEYEANGGYRYIIKSLEVPVGELKKVHKILLNPDDFPTEDWSG